MTTTLARRAGALALIAAAAATLTGCAGVIGAKMTYNDTEKTKITDIVLTGGSGDLVVTTGPVTETSITRIVRNSSNPAESYKLTGTTLNLDNSCGVNCSVSYQIKAPAGVAVRGQMTSGDIRLDGVGATDLQLTSGDLLVQNASGPVQIRATSGDIRVLDAKSTVKVHSTSGDIRAMRVGGAVEAEVTSGDVSIELAAPASVTAQTHSGDVIVTVPRGSYKLVTDVTSGDLDAHGLVSDATSKNVIDVRTVSGDVNVTSGA
jgi:DUF4097 and DUF4098 domain-containing protein YvlB